MKLNSPWYEHVKSGAKKYEGRRCHSIAKTINTGDTIEFSHACDTKLESFQRKVGTILKFKSFKEALSSVPLEQVLPGVSTIEQGDLIYQKYVSLATQCADGVLLIELL